MDRNSIQIKQVVTYQGHTSNVTSVAFSPDGKILATGSGEGIAKLWNVLSGTEIRSLAEHHSCVTAVAFTPCGKYLATGSHDWTTRIWHVPTGQRILAFQTAGDVETRKAYSSAAFSPNGTYLALGHHDTTAQLWNYRRGTMLRKFQGHSTSVLSLAFSPCGTRIVTGSTWNATLWDVETGAEIRTLEGSRCVYAVAFSPNGMYVATGQKDSIVKLWNVETGANVRTFEGHRDQVYAVAFSSHNDDDDDDDDGTILVTGSGHGIVKLWNVEHGTELLTFKCHEYSVTSSVFSPNGRYFATGSDDNTAKLWRIITTTTKTTSDLTTDNIVLSSHEAATAVLELTEKVSLDTFWVDDVGRSKLSWKQRLEIALHVATALALLHNGGDDDKGDDTIKSASCCYHRDIKSANIYLTLDFAGKVIKDCGLSKLVKDDTKSTSSSSTISNNNNINNEVLGTRGYICPQYQMGEIKHYYSACDVFSFGVVLVELFIGRLQNYELEDDGGSCNSMVFNFSSQYIVLNNSRRSGTKAKSIIIMDDRDPHAKWDLVAAQRFSTLAFRCMSPLADDRPLLSSIVRELESMVTTFCR